jgi:MYXO-CTERM domain-containing protein
VCTFRGGAGGAGGTGGTGEAGAPAGGQSSDAAPATGGTGAGGTGGTGFGGGAGTGVAGSGSAGVPYGGSSGIPAEGLCMPQGTGGTGTCPYCCPPGQIWTGQFCENAGAGGTGNVGGTGENGGSGGTDRNSEDEGETIVTHGGCALSSPNGSSPFALFLFAAAALARFSRRRSS